MASYSWIKLYHDILNDPKMGRLSDSAFRRCIQLFLLAGENPDRDGRLPSIADMAWTLRVSDEQMAADWAELEKAGIVALVDGEPLVVNFEKRQQALSGTERSRESRKRAAQAVGTQPLPEKQPAATELQRLHDASETTLEPDCNDDATAVTVECNDNATIRCADIDIDKEYTYTHAPARATAGAGQLKASPLYDPGPSEMVLAMITAVSGIVKETYWVETEERFETAAETLIGMDAEPEHLAGFLTWWEANGYYDGRPAIKTLIDEWRSFKAGVTKRPKSTNGAAPRPVPSVGLVEIEPGVY
jgi:DNA-binding transcriptional regulator YhcF (GntR family)